MLLHGPPVCCFVRSHMRFRLSCQHHLYKSRCRADMSTSALDTSAMEQKPLLSVAPMMDWTDVHFRQLARLLSKRTWLWTEMVVDKTVIHTPMLDKHLWFPPEQRPIVCQLGGSDPETLAAAAAVVARYGYDEINLNCGCPSDRVAGAGCFGASLMLDGELVGNCMAAVAAASGLPVNVKCRLGVDDADSYEQLREFVRTVSTLSPVKHFIVHARKCFLQGLNPTQNRTVPPLRHEWVFALKQDFPHLEFSLNGGLQSCYDAAAALAHVGPSDARIAGVMIGRGAYNDPWGCLSDADRAVFGETSNAAVSRREVLKQYTEYADAMLGRWQVKEDGWRDPSVRTLCKPLLNLFHGAPKCKRWKQAMDEALKNEPQSVSQVLAQTLHHFDDWVLDEPPTPTDAMPSFTLLGPMPEASSRAGTNQNPPGDKPERVAPPRRRKKKEKAAAMSSDSEWVMSSQSDVSESDSERAVGDSSRHDSSPGPVQTVAACVNLGQQGACGHEGGVTMTVAAAKQQAQQDAAVADACREQVVASSAVRAHQALQTVRAQEADLVELAAV